MSKYTSVMNRIVANSVQEAFTGCWVWTGQRHLGYAKMAVRKDGKVKKVRVIRVVLAETTDKTGDGLHAAHKCNNAACVNPHHLEWQSPQENIAEMWSRRKAK